MPELRIDPICGRRVYIAEERAGRPSDFTDVPASESAAAVRRAHCPFCAGHEAATPDASATVFDAAGRWQIRVVPNKYPLVGDGLTGAHEVVVLSPAHDLSFAKLERAQVWLLIQAPRLKICVPCFLILTLLI